MDNQEHQQIIKRLQLTYEEEISALKSKIRLMEKMSKEKIEESALQIQAKLMQAKISELENINKLMIGRELKMVELKKEIEELKKKLSEK